MIPYLIVFAFSLFLIHIAQRCEVGSLPYRVCLILVILFPAILAGLRDNTIGTDILTYVDDTWNDLKNVKSLGELLKRRSEDYFEVGSVGYLFMNYFLRSLSANPHIIYFGISLFVISFVVLAIKDNQSKASMPMMLFLFLFLYYNLSLNMMRQMMAMALGLYSYKYLERGQWLKLLLCITIMFMFHPTSFAYMICVALYFIYNMNSKLLRSLSIIGIICIMLLSFKYYNDMLAMLLSSGLVPMHYSLYYSTEEGVFQTSLLAIYFVFMLIFIYVWKCSNDKHTKKQVFYYGMFHLFAILFSMFSIVMYDAYRIAIYLLMMSIILFLPRTLTIAKKNGYKFYPIIWLVVILVSIVGWYYTNIQLGQNDTYPYKSSILGI